MSISDLLLKQNQLKQLFNQKSSLYNQNKTDGRPKIIGVIEITYFMDEFQSLASLFVGKARHSLSMLPFKNAHKKSLGITLQYKFNVIYM